MKRYAIAACLALIVAGAGVATAHEGLHGAVKKRMDIMSGFGKSLKSLSTTLKKGGKWDVPAVAKVARGIHAHAEQLPKLFPKGDIPPHSRSTPQIWEQWGEFNALLAELEARADRFADAAEAGDHAGAAKAFHDMGITCRNYHKTFRAPKRN
jgi:cytochrome c556